MTLSPRRALPALLLFVFILPLSGQEEDNIHFQLTSNLTYAPGQKATVEVWGHGVDSLEFRVYRVNDPISFFRKLEEKNQFGGEARPLERERSWLEWFHWWKRSWRSEIRDFFRLQYSAESRAQIRDWMLRKEQEKEKKPTGPTATEYAQVPVLNPEQLIATWQQPLAGGRYSYRNATVPVELPGKGLFLVEAVHKQRRAYTILNVTEIGLISKVWPGRVLVFAQHRLTGEPIPKLPVLLWVNRKEIRMETNGQGLAEAISDEERPEDTVLLARTKDDFAVSSLAHWVLGNAPERYAHGYVYTDRPVYRPGHTVNFKSILRNALGANYSLPAQREVSVEIEDPENNSVFRKTLPVSSLGTVHSAFTLADTAALGYYSVNVRAGGSTTYGGFHVEEYKKPEYEVRVRPELSRVLQGESIRATIEARYYFGEPVAGANVAWVVHTSAYWYPLYARDDEEGYDSEEEYEYDFGGEQLDEQSGKLDADGRLSIAIPTKLSEHKRDLRYRIEARVTDDAGREISGRNSVLATYGSFLVNVESGQYVVETGKPAKFLVEARNYDGVRLAVPATVTLHKWSWAQSREQLSPPLATRAVVTGTGSAIAVEFPVPEAGSYVAQVRAVTPEKREVESRTHVWVTGRGAFWGDAPERVQIIPDKKSYKPGKTARVLVITGVAGAKALVTTEGKVVQFRTVADAGNGSFTLDVPILRDYAPNFFLNVAFIRDNQFFQGTRKIAVPPFEQELNVELKPSKKEYKPGEPAVYSLTARDFAGRPVSGAEFSLGVVDEAIYAVRPEAARDILKYFYGSQYNRVNTSTSLSYYFTGASGKRAMELAFATSESSRARPLAQLKPERLVEPKIRRAFPDTAFWVADMTTDGAGRATARFTFPDALTTWRATTRGITRDTKVGSAVERTVVRKNLLVRLAVPRFFTEGDEVTVSVLVHNYLAAQKSARVSLIAEGAELIEGNTRDIAVPSRGEMKIDWRIRAKPGREVKILGKALTGEESDAMELSLPIIPFGVKQAIARSGSSAERAAEIDSVMEFPAGATAHSRSVEISVSPSVAGALFGALEYLTAFPYGCTEQTMSSFLPNIIVARALKDLNVKSNVDEAVLQKKIQQGLQRLRDFQHDDGGWGWWQSDESHTFMTAYVLAGLVQAKSAGYALDYDLESARKWLREAFDRESRAMPDLRAYVAYALALSGTRDAAVLDAVWQRRNDMTPYGRALLGLALDAAGDARARDIAAQLEAEARSDAGEAWWPVDNDHLMGFYGDTSPEATAHAVKLLARHRPQSPLLPKAAVWLMRNRNSGYYWTSTKQTAMVIYGLTDFLKLSGELKPNFSISVSVNGRPVLTHRFTEADALAVQSPKLKLPAEQLAAGVNRIHITKSGAGTLYWSVRGEYFSTDENLLRTGSVKLILLREYFRLVAERKAEKIVYRLEPLAGAVHQGDVLAVRLTVSGDEWRYLHIEDPIPAGTEFIEKDDLYELEIRPPWWRYWFSRRELRDDRAAIFQTWFGRGQQQYFYLLKVVNPGRFRVSPARVQPMYQPQFLSTTDSRIVEVQ